ncbi:MAG: cryptochrome/photolyase family protein [Betaproteobacteria bacterium]
MERGEPKGLGSAALAWFRRDLRDDDHAALHAALVTHCEVHCAFVFDTEILDALEAKADRRVAFIRDSLVELKAALESRGGGLHVLHGRAREEIPGLARKLGVAAVYANRDYEPQAIARDAEVKDRLAAQGIAFHTRKDQVIFELDEVRTKTGEPFSVFTPYKNAWLAKLDPFFVKAYPVGKHLARLAPGPATPVPSLASLGFQPAELPIPAGMSGAAMLLADFRRRIAGYRDKRDFPALKGPSYLSTHLRFGTVSIRALAALAWKQDNDGARTWLSELVWRDFYHAILAWRPDVVSRSFRREYDAVKFDANPAGWKAWCEGRTGYPLVDAAMRQLNHTGYMHNRLRMVAASFLVKDLGIDWRRGERYFAATLNDYDLAANNGGWQWAASTGCDAQPWFRVFNPVMQSEKFDSQGKFIRRYVPELAQVRTDWIHLPWTMPPLEQHAAGCEIGRDYPAPMVEHAAARIRTLARYAVVKKSGA